MMMRAIAIALFAGLGVATPAMAQNADWSKVIEAAKREGEVTIYSAYISPTHDAVAKAFTAKYGIKVNMLTARGREVIERARIEQASGRLIGDLMHNAVSQTLVGRDTDKVLQPIGALPSAARIKQAFRDRIDDYMMPIFTINYGMLVNTMQVKPEEMPKKWGDLLDAKWAGKLLMDDPRSPGGGGVFFRMTYSRYGVDFVEKFAAQKPMLSRDYQEAGKRIGRGELQIYLPFIFSELAPLAGLPVKHVIPEDGVTYGSYAISLFKDAPHPNAARLMADFYLSDEVQMIYARAGLGIMVAPKDPLPPEIAAVADVKPLAPEEFARMDEMYAEAKRVYK